MSKKKIILIAVLVIVVFAAAGVSAFNLTKSSQVSSPVTSLSPTPTVTEEELVAWTDPAEFTFQYPKSLILDPHDEDEKNYAHVELKSATHSGNLIVWVKDTTAEDITEWERIEKIQNSIDSNLGGENAKKVLLNGESRKIITSTIYGGYLYQIEVNPEDFEYWNSIYNQVIGTFKFTPVQDISVKKPNNTVTQNSDDQNTPDGDESVEEEIVE